jgi:hypothetical protein
LSTEQLRLVARLEQLDRRRIDVVHADEPGGLGDELRMLVEIPPEIGHALRPQSVHGFHNRREILVPDADRGGIEDATVACLARLDDAGLALGTGEAAIHERRRQPQRQQHGRRAGDAGCQVRIGQTVGDDLLRRGQRLEAGGRHARVMHAGDGRAHDDGAADLLPQALRPHSEPQGRRRRRDGDHDRQAEEHGVIAEARRHAHRRHAGVVHGDDTDPSEDAAAENGGPRPMPVKDDEQSQAGNDDRDHQRQQRRPHVIGDDHAEPEGEHGDEMHRPDAAAHGHRAGQPPAGLRPAARLAHPAGQVERGEGRQNGDGNRQRHEPGVVVTVQRSIRQAVVFKHRCVFRRAAPILAPCQLASRMVPYFVHKRKAPPSAGPFMTGEIGQRRRVISMTRCFLSRKRGSGRRGGNAGPTGRSPWGQAGQA